jgi:hypothetical protein
MRVSRRLIAETLVVVAASLLAQPAANASLDKGLCNYDPTRGAIPPDFFVDACFDGKTLQLHNQSKIVLHVNASGALGPATRTETDLGLTAAATRLKSSDPWLLLPDDTLHIRVGSGAGRVSVQQALHGDEVYGLGKALEATLPVAKAAKGAQAVTKLGKAADKTAEVAGKINTWAALIDELASNYDQYSTCLAGANWFMQLGCRSLLARNVGFAYGRFGAKVGIAAVDVLLSEVEFIAFVHARVENAQSLKKRTGSIVLSAVATPTPSPRPAGRALVPAQPPSGNPPVGDVAVTCFTDGYGALPEFIGYDTANGHVVFDHALPSAQFRGLSPSCTVGSYGWNSQFTRYAGAVSTPNNGKVPYLADLSDPANPKGNPIVPTDSGTQFKAGPSYNAEDAVVDPAGNVWWYEFTDSGAHNLKVFEGTRLRTTTTLGYLPGPISLEFRGHRWALEFASETGGSPSYLSPGGTKILTQDPLAIPAPTLSASRLAALLPATNLGLSDGYYNSARTEVYFIASGPSGTTLYSVPAQGGTPTPVVKDLESPPSGNSAVSLVAVVSNAAYRGR